ncbi:MAG: hypothetical protein IJV56_05250 [Neisseriaceae bacterium]|nr:hypothetical protein [Neisseriaceae bacterium]MBQ9724733.1 hypothetical protein [Neisseriaceae bacterium]
MKENSPTLKQVATQLQQALALGAILIATDTNELQDAETKQREVLIVQQDILQKALDSVDYLDTKQK